MIFNDVVLTICADVRMTVLLLKHGADPNIGDWTPLLKASYHGRANQVKLLCEHGANPLLRNSNGNTALSVCDGKIIRSGDYPTTRAILEEYIDKWKSVPSLIDMCIWKLKLMRPMIDEEWFVDHVPDATVREHFRDWQGTERWL